MNISRDKNSGEDGDPGALFFKNHETYAFADNINQLIQFVKSSSACVAAGKSHNHHHSLFVHKEQGNNYKT